MAITSRLRDFLFECEGCELQCYADSGGALTIGVGHLLTKAERTSGKIQIGQKSVRYGKGITRLHAEQLLAQDLVAQQVWSWYVSVPLTEAQREALASFVFNCGLSAFQNSTLLKLLNQGKYDQVPTQLRRWIYDGGKVVNGLVNRRNKEIALWEGRWPLDSAKIAE